MIKLKVCTGKMMMWGNTLTEGGGTQRQRERDYTALAVLWSTDGRRRSIITPPEGRRAAARNRAEKPNPVGTGPGWRCNIPDVEKPRPVVLRRVSEAVIHICVAYVFKYDVADTHWLDRQGREVADGLCVMLSGQQYFSLCFPA